MVRKSSAPVNGVSRGSARFTVSAGSCQQLGNDLGASDQVVGK